AAYGNPRKGGIYAIEIRENDRLIEAKITSGEDDIVLGTREGKSIRFSERDIRASGRKTMGVRGIRLSSKEDRVVGMVVVRREGTVLVATENGLGKRTDIIQYRVQKRGGKGVMTMRTTKKTGKMVAIMEVVDSDDLIVITDRGVLIRQAIAPIRTIGRVTQGVKLIQLDAKDKIASITRVLHEEDVDLPESPENGDELSSDENIGEASDNEVKT
ncbi:MAG TPA: DNA gyrase subunit A, partial [Candidatus Marinimicrobia bacterium]|nr:DNA gyrase subunit A [Candidatus Neomarinimicrobiota bacterium]